MNEWTTITNNVPRDVIDGWDLTPKERDDFDYIDWPAVESGEASATFFRYRGTLYDLNDFMYVDHERLPADSPLRGWHGYQADSFFSAVVVRYVTDDCESIVVGTVLT